MPLRKIDWSHCHQHPHRARRDDHDTAFTAHSTACNVVASAPSHAHCHRADDDLDRQRA
jgi:hypothetical protein